MADEGYGLTDPDEEVEEPEHIETGRGKKNMYEQFDMPLLVGERHKLHQEITIKEPEYKERIGRINYHLFGDPKNPDSDSKIDKFERETTHPYTKGHPLSNMAEDVIKLVKELQVEYVSLHTFYRMYAERVGHLLDKVLNIYQEEDAKNRSIIITLERKLKDNMAKTVQEAGDDDFEKKKVLTYGVVDQFMDDFEGKKWLELFNREYDRGNKHGALSARANFIKNGMSFFRAYHENPREFSVKLFRMKTADRVFKKDVIEKFLSPKIGGNPDSLNQAPIEGLSEEAVGEEEPMEEEEDTGKKSSVSETHYKVRKKKKKKKRGKVKRSKRSPEVEKLADEAKKMREGEE